MTDDLPVVAEALREHADLLAAIVDALLIEGHEAVSANLRGRAHSAVVAYRDLSGFYDAGAE